MKNGVIPQAAKIVATVLALIGIACVVTGVVIGIADRGGDAEVGAVLGLIAVVLAGFALLVGYVHGDAKRRGMRYVMWTWLAILVPNGIGIVLYFILRDPMPNFCTSCGAAVARGYGFCPRCGSGIAASCKKCNRVCQEGWTHCAYCGTQL